MNNSAPSIEVLLSRLAELRVLLVRFATSIDINQLPSTEIRDYRVSSDLPGISAVYFLSHADYGLLYIGRAVNLRSRFSYVPQDVRYPDTSLSHERLFQAVRLGGVRLSWLQTPREINKLLEETLIGELQPRLNYGTRKKKSYTDEDLKLMKLISEPRDPNRFRGFGR